MCEKCYAVQYDHIHHVDGNPSNNSVGNLLMLCYKCHLAIHHGERLSPVDNRNLSILTKAEVRKVMTHPELLSKVKNLNLDVGTILGREDLSA